VTTPQDLVSMIVAKAVNMARMMHVPVIGLVENYSYFECPDCGKRVEVFGKSHLDALAAEYGLPVLARLPIRAEVAELLDQGRIEEADVPALSGAVEAVARL